jgi:hypothetical protein
MSQVIFVIADNPIKGDIGNLFEGESLSVRIVPNGRSVGNGCYLTIAATDGGSPFVQFSASGYTIDATNNDLSVLSVGATYFFNLWTSAGVLLAYGRIYRNDAILPNTSGVLVITTDSTLTVDSSTITADAG